MLYSSICWFYAKLLKQLQMAVRSYSWVHSLAGKVEIVLSMIVLFDNYGDHPTINRPHMMTSSNGNSFCVTGPLRGKCTGHQWIPLPKAQWRGALMFYLICAWTNGWANNRDTGDLKHHRVHHNVTATELQKQIVPVEFMLLHVMPVITSQLVLMNKPKAINGTMLLLTSIRHQAPQSI